MAGINSHQNHTLPVTKSPNFAQHFRPGDRDYIDIRPCTKSMFNVVMNTSSFENHHTSSVVRQGGSLQNITNINHTINSGMDIHSNFIAPVNTQNRDVKPLVQSDSNLGISNNQIAGASNHTFTNVSTLNNTFKMESDMEIGIERDIQTREINHKHYKAPANVPCLDSTRGVRFNYVPTSSSSANIIEVKPDPTVIVPQSETAAEIHASSAAIYNNCIDVKPTVYASQPSTSPLEYTMKDESYSSINGDHDDTTLTMDRMLFTAGTVSQPCSNLVGSSDVVSDGSDIITSAEAQMSSGVKNVNCGNIVDMKPSSDEIIPETQTFNVQPCIKMEDSEMISHAKIETCSSVINNDGADVKPTSDEIISASQTVYVQPCIKPAESSSLCASSINYRSDDIVDKKPFVEMVLASQPVSMSQPCMDPVETNVNSESASAISYDSDDIKFRTVHVQPYTTVASSSICTMKDEQTVPQPYIHPADSVCDVDSGYTSAIHNRTVYVQPYIDDGEDPIEVKVNHEPCEETCQPMFIFHAQEGECQINCYVPESETELFGQLPLIRPETAPSVFKKQSL